MSSDRRRALRGMTLIELIVAILVLGVGLAGVLLAYGTVTRGSADPVISQQMLGIAEELLEEIELKPYAPAANTAPPACARNTYNDLSDYHGYSSSGRICSIDGVPIAALDGYSVSVAVETLPLAGVAAAKRIRISVQRGDRTLILTGWRTDYGG